MAKKPGELTDLGLQRLYLHMIDCYEQQQLESQLEWLKEAERELTTRGLGKECWIKED